MRDNKKSAQLLFFLGLTAAFSFITHFAEAQQFLTPGKSGTIKVINIDNALISPYYLFSFNKNVSLGSRGTSVKSLQQFLNMYGFIVAKTGHGSEGNETEYFGLSTKRALAKFQSTYHQRILLESGSSKISIGTLDIPTRAFMKKVVLTQNSTCDFEKYKTTKRSTGVCSVNDTFTKPAENQQQTQASNNKNEGAVVSVDYAVGNDPRGIAFDSVTKSIWVVNSSDDTVSKINIYDGTKVNYIVGGYPKEIVFDNITNSIWVTNHGSNNVSKVDINTGTKINYDVGPRPLTSAFPAVNPAGIAFDPVTKSAWVGNSGTNFISKVNIYNGVSTDYVVGDMPRCVAFDNITDSIWTSWVASGTTEVISKVNIYDGTKIDYIFKDSVGCVTFDPVTKSVWRIDDRANIVSRISIYDGAKTDYAIGKKRSVDTFNNITFNNITNFMWVANFLSNTISKINIYDGTITDYAVEMLPYGIAFDSVTKSMWVTKYGAGKVSKIGIKQ